MWAKLHLASIFLSEANAQPQQEDIAKKILELLKDAEKSKDFKVLDTACFVARNLSEQQNKLNQQDTNQKDKDINFSIPERSDSKVTEAFYQKLWRLSSKLKSNKN